MGSFGVSSSPLLAKAGCHRRTKDPTVQFLARAPFYGRRIVICDYNALLISITGLLRMSGYCVFQAYDGRAARELCHGLPNIELVILNTTGTGEDSPGLVRDLRQEHANLAVLHVGPSVLKGMPDNVPTLVETFTADQLLSAVDNLLPERRRDTKLADFPVALN